MNPEMIEIFGKEGLDENIDKTKREMLEKFDSFNKYFKSNIQPENGSYGVTEKINNNGVLERTFKNSNGEYRKDYVINDRPIKSRFRIDDKSLKYLMYDDNGNEYLEKVYRQYEGKSNYYKESEKLLPNKIINHENFTSVTDSNGRVISAKVTDLSVKENGRKSLNIDKIDKGYLENDQISHLIPDSFNGRNTIDNIVPQLDKVNLGKIKKVENIARRIKEQGHKVDYEMRVNYGDKNNPKRPSSFEPKITVDGQEYKLDSELKKIYNNSDLSKIEKVKTTMNEKINSTKMNTIEANGFGKESALIAGGLTFVTSTVEDIKLVIDGDMQVEDMVLDIVQDTSIAGGLGYMEGFTEGAICAAMRKSGSTMIAGLAKTGIPAMAIDFAIKSYDSVADYAEGNIDELELMYDLGENATTTIATFETAKLGAMLGSGMGPLGTVTGGLLGGMVGYCVSSELYVAAVDLGVEGAEFLAEKANEFGEFCVDVTTEYIPEFVDDVATSLNDFASNFDLPFSF